MALNLAKIIQASLKTIVLGSVLVLVFVLLVLLGYFLGPTDEGHIVSLGTSVFWVLLLPTFFILFFWTGYNGSRRFRLTAVEAGTASAVAYLAIGALNFVLRTILIILSISDVLKYQLSPSFFNMGGLFGDLAMIGISLCAIVQLMLGVCVNFVIGMCGGILSENN